MVADLTARRWLQEDDGLLHLTEQGRREQAALAPLVEEVRRQVAAALPAEDYRTLVSLLERLVDGLSEEPGPPV